MNCPWVRGPSFKIFLTKKISLLFIECCPYLILNNNSFFIFLSFLKNITGKIHCDITGGVDTRAVIAILDKLKVQFNVGVQAITEYEDFSNYGKFSELNIVDEIVKHKNLDFELPYYYPNKYM